MARGPGGTRELGEMGEAGTTHDTRALGSILSRPAAMVEERGGPEDVAEFNYLVVLNYTLPRCTFGLWKQCT